MANEAARGRTPAPRQLPGGFLLSDDGATRLRLRVVPGGRGDAVVGRYGDGWKVRVAARPERGAANRALVRFLADTLSLPDSDVAVVSGHGARDKIVEVRGIAPPVTEGRLSAAERKEPGR